MIQGSKYEFGAETLEVQKGIIGKTPIQSDTVLDTVVPDSPTAEESLNNKVVEAVLNSLKDTIHVSNVVSDVGTSLAQEKPTSGVVGTAADNAMSIEVDVGALADLELTVNEVACSFGACLLIEACV